MTDKKMIEISLSEDDALHVRGVLSLLSGDACDSVKRQIDEQTKPKMDEPMEFGARVRTDDGWAVRYVAGTPDYDWADTWIYLPEGDKCGVTCRWPYLKNPHPVETEVPDGYIMIKRPKCEGDIVCLDDLKVLRDDASNIVKLGYGEFSFCETIPSLIRNYADVREKEINK